MGQSPNNSDVYIFINKKRNRMKLLHWESGGLEIYSKMLDKDTFAPLALFYIYNLYHIENKVKEHDPSYEEIKAELREIFIMRKLSCSY